jgi:hypothetical protein
MTSPRLACFLLLLVCGTTSSADSAQKPRFADFMGINGHYHFRPELYRPVATQVRNYHPMTWDLPGNTAEPTVFPRTRQRVDGELVEWDKVYGTWKAAGFRIDASIQFEFIRPDAWTDLPRDAETYGRAFAQALGPSSRLALVEAAEATSPRPTARNCIAPYSRRWRAVCAPATPSSRS